KTGKGNAYESDLRDKKHGRIYRIVYTGTDNLAQASADKDAKGSYDGQMVSSQVPDLAKADEELLLAKLHSTNFLWLRHAQRLLMEDRSTNVVQLIIEMVKEPSIDEIGLATDINHALWTLHGRGALDGRNRDALRVVVRALTHPSAGVR